MENKENHLSKEQIAIYAEALAIDNSVNLPDNVKRHAKDCDKCISEIHAVSEILRDNYKNSIADGLNNAKKSSNTSIRFWLVATASIIILATLGYLFTRDNTVSDNTLMAIDSTLFESNNIASTYKEIDNNISDTVSITNSDTIKPKNKRIALAYVSNKDLEKLVNRFNNINMRSEGISISTPSSIVFSKNDSINIKWKNTNNQYLTIEIFDNKGKRIASKTSSKDIVTITEITKKGLYYWKLINEDSDILFCGKIKYNK